MRQPKPFFRKQTRSWYVQLGKRQINLGKNEDEAKAKYHQLMLEHNRRAAVIDDTVAGILEAYWQWLKANRAETTANVRRPILKSYRVWIGTKHKAWQLKPHHVQGWCAETYGKQSTKAEADRRQEYGLYLQAAFAN